MAEATNRDTAGATAYTAFWLWHRCLKERPTFGSLLPSERFQWAVETVVRGRTANSQPSEWESPLLDEVANCALTIILSDDRPAELPECIAPLMVRPLLAGFKSNAEMFDAWHRLQAACALALLVTEIRSTPEPLNAILDKVLSMAATLDDDAFQRFTETWSAVSDKSLSWNFGITESIGYKYDQFFLVAEKELRALDPAYERFGHRPLNHWSSFLQKHWDGTIDAADCAAEFLTRLKAGRAPKPKPRPRRRRTTAKPEAGGADSAPSE